MFSRPHIEYKDGEETYHKKSIAVTAFEAGLVINSTICRQSVDEMNSFIASLAFLLGPAERHFLSFVLFFVPSHSNLLR